jgi:hypothetical protein
MAQRARFWLYRAGTPVLSTLGQPIGHVAAVRPDAVLVVCESGHERWFPATEVVDVSDRGLVVCVSQEIAWDLPPTSPRSPEPEPIPDTRVALRESLPRFDA